MALVSALITNAYRESNIIAVGTSPTAAAIAEGLDLTNRYIASLFGREAGEALSSLALGSQNVQTDDLLPIRMDDYLSYYVPSNTRLQCNLSSAVTVNLNPYPADGERFGVVDNSANFNTYNLTVVGNGRKIEAATSVVLSTASLAREWFYREDTGNWTRLSTLISSDSSPFPSEFDDMISIGISMRLNPRYGIAADGQSVAYYRDLLSKFKARYRQTKEVKSEDGLLNPRIYGAGNTTREFQIGRTV